MLCLKPKYIAMYSTIKLVFNLLQIKLGLSFLTKRLNSGMPAMCSKIQLLRPVNSVHESGDSSNHSKCIKLMFYVNRTYNDND